MTLRDTISSYSRGELAPQKNTFVQPGTYKDNPDTAMTDGVKHAMLHAQRAIHSQLINPYHVRAHLKKHHGKTNDTDTPLADHARSHTLAQLTQGHSISVDGDLHHGSTDIAAGTANFAAEAPPMIELIRHVRTAEGAAFYKKSIGTPLIGDPEQTYLSQKAKNDAAKAAEDKLKAEKTATSHADLLAARTKARADYPAGHPTRLAAERAVRASRKTSSYREGRSEQAHVSTAKKARDMRRDPGYVSPKETIIANGPKSGANRTGVDGLTSTTEKRLPVPTSEQVAHRLDEVSQLSAGEKSRYYAMRQAGINHTRALTTIDQQRSRTVPPAKVVTQLRGRRRTRG